MSITDLDDEREDQRFGGKATELGAAVRAGLPVPDGIAVSHGLVEQLVETGNRRSDLVARVEELEAPYVVRSSGIGEDSTEASFAGQHVTVVNIAAPSGVIEAIERVYASSRSEAVMAYRSELGIEEPPKMAVVVQTLVDADKAGVLFSRNPVDGSDERVIEASWGLGEAVVDSMVTPDNYRMRPGGEILERRAGMKDTRVTPAPGGGTKTERVPDDKQEQLCLNDEELRALDGLAKQCDDYRSGGHDIEWAFEDDDLYLLQRRDITTT